MRQRRVAAGNGLSIGLSTTIKYVRRTASGAAGSGLGTSIKYLRRTTSGAAGNGLSLCQRLSMCPFTKVPKALCIRLVYCVPPSPTSRKALLRAGV